MVTVCARVAIQPIVTLHAFEQRAIAYTKQHVVTGCTYDGGEVEKRRKVKTGSRHDLEGSITLCPVSGRIGAQVFQYGDDPTNTLSLPTVEQRLQFARQQGPIDRHAKGIGAECRPDDVQLTCIFSLRKYLRRSETLEFQVFGHQNRRSLTMRIGIALPPAP